MFLPRLVDRYLLLPLALLAFAFCSRHARAEDLRFQLGQHWVQIISPTENWVDANKDTTWYSGNTPDETVWLSTSMFDWLTDERLKTWLPRHLESFGYNVKFDWTTFHSAKGRVRDWNVTDYFVTGTNEQGPCEAAITVFELDEKARFVVTTGGSPANRQKHRRTVETILFTIKRSQEPILKPQ
jgi:hypothetical protein